MRALFGPRNRRARGTGTGRWVPARATLVRGALVVAALGLAVAGGPPVLRAVRRHPYFAVREVVVGPHRHLTAEAIRTAAGIVPGMSVWDVDGGTAETRLAREPWVRSARVHRELPHRIVVAVREYRPVAILATADTPPALYYVAAHGQPFAAVGAGDPRDFPYLTGLSAADVHHDGAFAPRAIRRALFLLRLVAHAQVSGAAFLGAVSEIHVDRTRGLTVLPTRPAVPFEIGWTGFEEKLAHLPAVMALWAGREAEIAGVSLLFADEVIVRTRQPPAGRRAARS